MTKRFQMIHTYTFDKNGETKTSKSSFKTLENAITDAAKWIDKAETWIDTTVVSIVIIDKETGKHVWTHTA